MRKAFTLIEILVVVAIFGMLVTLVLLAIQSRKPKTNFEMQAFCQKEIQTKTLNHLPDACRQYVPSNE